MWAAGYRPTAPPSRAVDSRRPDVSLGLWRSSWRSHLGSFAVGKHAQQTANLGSDQAPKAILGLLAHVREQ